MSLIIREMRINQHEISPHIRKDINQKTRVGKDVEKLEPLYTVGWNLKWCGHYGKQHGGPLVMLYILMHL